MKSGKNTTTCVACSVFRPELEALQKRGEIDLNVKYLDSNLHMYPDKLRKSLDALIEKELEEGRRVVLVYGDCHAYISDQAALPMVTRVKGANCCEILLGRDEYKKRRTENAFYLLPEWTTRWKEILTRIAGLDEASSIEIMRERHSKFVYLDTGAIEAPNDEIKACAGHFGFDSETLEVSLDCFSNAIKEAVKDEGRNNPLRNTASAVMMLDVINSVLNYSGNIQIAVETILEWFRGLSGAAIVTIIHNSSQGQAESATGILGINPERKRPVVDSIEAENALGLFSEIGAPSLIRPDPNGNGVESLLHRKNLGLTFVIPLLSGAKRLGTIIAFGMKDDPFVGSIVDQIIPLSRTIGLVIHNSILFSEQKEANQFNRQVINSAQEGVTVYGRDLRYQVWNPFMENLTGVPAGKVLGKHPLEIFPALKDAGVIEKLEKALAGEATETIEFPLQIPENNTNVWASDTSAPLRNSEGEIIGVIGTVQDISRRKRAEAELIFKNTLLNAQSEASLDGILVVNDEGKSVMANNRFREIWDIPDDIFNTNDDNAMLQHVLAKLKNPNAFIDKVNWLYAHKEEKSRDEIEFKDGKVLDRYSAPVEDAGGKRYGRVWYFRDITERKLAEDALRMSEEKYRAIFEESFDGIFVTSPEGKILDMNKKGVIMFGYDTKEEIQRLDLVKDVYANPLDRQRILSLVNDQGCAEYDVTVKKKNGETMLTHCSLSAVRNECGAITAYRGIITDITDRTRAEEEAKKMQAQLYQSQKMEAVGQLAGGMAHDFNNMLGVIMSATELASLDTGEDSPAQEDLKTIIEAVRKARDLTMKLLTFARRDKISVAGVEAGKIVESLRGMLSRTIPKNIRIEIAVNDELFIKCDQNQIHQSLLNICNNAVDAMPGGGTLTIEAEEALLPDGICDECGKKLNGKYCLIQVSDTGIGMPKDILAKITEPFFTTKGVGKGTGLGLSVTHGIILSHNGHLHIYSEPGEGTCVKIYLPIDEDAAAPAEARLEKAPLRGSETILIVDDEEQLLQMAGRLLANNGYKPLTANNGEAAIGVYRKHRREIAVVVLDIMMPGMDGKEVNLRLKELNPAVKVVFSSGFSANGVVGNLLKDKARRFVQKPFETVALCQAIRELIDGGD